MAAAAVLIATLLEGCAAFAAFPGPMGCSAVGSPVPLVLYSLCVSKLQWYIYVCLPPLAVGVGMALGKLARGGLPLRMECLATPGLPGCGGCHDGFPGPEVTGRT